jgi:hypothetical protein
LRTKYSSGNLKGTIPLGSTTNILKNIIKMDLKEKGVDWTQLALHRAYWRDVVNTTIINLSVT